MKILLVVLFAINVFAMEIGEQPEQGSIVDGKFVAKESNATKEINTSIKNPNKDFPFTYIYDVNLDKCVTTDSYKGKFSFNDLKNPKAVLEFPQRPGELTLVLPNGDMYVFTLDKLGCQNYRAHFFEDMSRQNKMEDERYKDIDIDRN